MSIRKSFTRTINGASAATKTYVGRLTGNRRLRNKGRVEQGKNDLGRSADKLGDNIKI